MQCSSAILDLKSQHHLLSKELSQAGVPAVCRASLALLCCAVTYLPRAPGRAGGSLIATVGLFIPTAELGPSRGAGGLRGKGGAGGGGRHNRGAARYGVGRWEGIKGRHTAGHTVCPAAWQSSQQAASKQPGGSQLARTG